MLIDSHAHLDSERFSDDRIEMLRRAYEAGVEAILSIGIGEDAQEMGEALRICRELNALPISSDTHQAPLRPGAGLPTIYCSAGVYPHNTPEINAEILTELDRLLGEPEVIACGEIGLDYYHEGAPHEVQKQGLIAQLEIARRHKRPILIHCRPKDGQTDAFEDFFRIIEEHWDSSIGGIMHCFGGGLAQAERAIELGFLVSFAGNSTYPKAQPLRDVAARLPLDKLVIETDAPWLAPASNRGKRNEPAMIAETARIIAELHGLAVEDFGRITTKNFLGLFRLNSNVGN